MLHRKILRRATVMSRLMLWIGRSPRLRRETVRIFAEKPDVFERFLAAHVGVASDPNLAASTLLVGWHMLSA